MTVAEAKAFIDAAERLPVDEVDPERLEEASRVLTMPFPVDADYARRVEALVSKVVDRRTTIQEARASRVEGTPPSERGSGSSAGESLGGQDAVSDAGAPRLSPEFESRLREAAAGAGVPEAEVDNLVAQAAVVAQQAAQMGQGQTVNLESLLQSQLDEWERIAERNAPTPIGVPQGFVAEPQVELHAADRARFGGAARAGVEVEPRYFEGDHLIPASFAAEDIAGIQQRLVDAGLLDPENYWAGFWDDATANAYGTVLGYSNQRGTDWQTTIDALIRSVPDAVKEQNARAAAAAVFQEPAYIKPDYATLAQTVKQMFRSEVGRDPTKEELAGLSGELSGLWKAQHDAAVAAARAEFNAERGLIESAEEGEALPESVSAGTFQGIDPGARLQELFETRYAPEIDRLDSLGAVRANTENVFASLRTLDSLIGGGR